MADNYKYGYVGPPFNFLGHFSESQKTAFNGWVNARIANFAAIQLHYQIRAAQYRKTAGVLEKFYVTDNDEKLSPTFTKNVWQPGANGWFGYAFRDDHLPMVTMSKIKGFYREQLERQDDSVFQMNHLRNLIERTEDNAQKAKEAPANIATLLNKIEGYFSKPEYQAVLVKDLTDVYPTGSGNPRFRVHQLDVPTTWEQEQAARTTPGGPVVLKEENQ